MNSTAKNLITAAGLYMVASSGISADIRSVATMQDVQQTIEKLLETYKAPDIVVAFDIDMTITQPDHPALYYPNMIQHRDIYKKIMSSVSAEERDFIKAQAVMQTSSILVEPSTPSVIQALQEKQIKTLALTAFFLGSQLWRGQERIEVARFQDLRNQGIDFQRTFSAQTLVFRDMPPHSNQYPLFYKGILFSNGEEGATTKGSVLIAFLKTLTLNPKVIILIDDRRKNLEDVHTHLRTYDPTIQFIGIEYQGALTYCPHHISQEDFQEFWESIKKHLPTGH